MYRPEIEYASKDEIKTYQGKEMRKMLSYLKEHSCYYQTLFQKEKIDINRIKTVDDLCYFPVT
ncbi:MAG: phenylacetate--CoA ligase family protein, partial [Bacteroidales bacterium]